MPVDVVRRHFGQHPGDPETLELRHPPFMDEAVLMADPFAVRPHASPSNRYFSFQPDSVNGWLQC
jgi:hypothetical protein